MVIDGKLLIAHKWSSFNYMVRAISYVHFYRLVMMTIIKLTMEWYSKSTSKLKTLWFGFVFQIELADEIKTGSSRNLTHIELSCFLYIKDAIRVQTPNRGNNMINSKSGALWLDYPVCAACIIPSLWSNFINSALLGNNHIAKHFKTIAFILVGCKLNMALYYAFKRQSSFVYLWWHPSSLLIALSQQSHTIQPSLFIVSSSI